MWLSFGVDEYFQLRKRFFSECFYSTLVFIDLDIMSLHFLRKCAYQELSSFKKNPEKFFRMWLISLSCLICQKNFYYYKHIWNLSILYLHRTKFELLYWHLVLPIIRKKFLINGYALPIHIFGHLLFYIISLNTKFCRWYLKP